MSAIEKVASRPWSICLALAAAVVITFWPASEHGFVNYDDKDYVTENPRVLAGLTAQGMAWAFASNHAGNWHPLTWLSHMTDVELFGTSPAGHHLVSVCLHALNAVLLFLLFRQMTGATWRSAILAGIFALHPLRVESVAWISERKDVLSGLFFILTLMAYARYVRGAASETPATQSKGGEDRSRSFRVWKWYWLALALFAMGLMSKPMLVTLPFVLLLLDVWPLGRIGAARPRRGQVQQLLLEKAPFLALTVLSSVATFAAQKEGGAVQTLTSIPFPERAANAVIACVRYVGKVVWPADLSPFYPHPGHWPVIWVIAAILFLVVVSALGLWQMRQRPYVAAGWFWYLGMLVPVLGLVQVGSQALADRYTYLPTIGLTAALVWAAAAWSERRPQVLQVLPWGTAALLIGLAAMARHQVHFWKDSTTLFEHAVAVTPENFVTRFYLGNAQLEKGDLARGAATMQRVLELNPGFANAHTSLAYAYAMRGETALTVSHYKSALQLRPDWADPMNNLAWLLATAKDPSIRDGKEAVRLAERATELTGHQQPMILGTLAAAYAETGDFKRAIETAERARALATAARLKLVADRNSELIELYKAGRPFREK